MGCTSSHEGEIIQKIWQICYIGLPLQTLKDTMQQLSLEVKQPVQNLYTHHVNMRTPSTAHFSLLHLACFCGHLLPVPQWRTRQDCFEALRNKKEIAQFLLLGKYAEVNETSNTFGMTPLHVLCDLSSTRAQDTKQFLSKNAEKVALMELKQAVTAQHDNLRNRNNNTANNFSPQSGASTHTTSSNALSANNSNNNSNPNQDPLEEYRQLLLLLIVEGANLDALAIGGITPLMLAAYNHVAVAVDELVGRGAKVSIYDNLTGMISKSCFHYLIDGSSNFGSLKLDTTTQEPHLRSRNQQHNNLTVKILQTFATVASLEDKNAVSAKQSLVSYAYQGCSRENRDAVLFFMLKNGFGFFRNFLQDISIENQLRNVGTKCAAYEIFQYQDHDISKNSKSLAANFLPPNPSFFPQKESQLHQLADLNPLAASIILGHIPLFKHLLDTFGHGSLLASIGPRKITPFHLLLSSEPESFYDREVGSKMIKYIFLGVSEHDEHQQDQEKKENSAPNNVRSETMTNFLSRCFSVKMDDGTTPFEMNENGKALYDELMKNHSLGWADFKSVSSLLASCHIPEFQRGITNTLKINSACPPGALLQSLNYFNKFSTLVIHGDNNTRGEEFKRLGDVLGAVQQEEEGTSNPNLQVDKNGDDEEESGNFRAFTTNLRHLIIADAPNLSFGALNALVNSDLYRWCLETVTFHDCPTLFDLQPERKFAVTTNNKSYNSNSNNNICALICSQTESVRQVKIEASKEHDHHRSTGSRKFKSSSAILGYDLSEVAAVCRFALNQQKAAKITSPELSVVIGGKDIVSHSEVTFRSGSGGRQKSRAARRRARRSTGTGAAEAALDILTGSV